MSNANKKIYIGTSGWHYAHWKGPFYPDPVSPDEFLSFYSGRLDSVEINNSFYRLPRKETLKEWKQTVPHHFLFTIKASRYITHMKKLKNPEESVGRFFDTAQALQPKLGPVLFQLPPRWKKNTGRLREFLIALPRGNRYAFEFRDPSWFAQDVYDLLGAFNCAFCIYELSGVSSPREVTADFVYIRLHGPGGAYEGKYSRKALAGWAGACTVWAQKGEVFCYFDNDQNGYAAGNAVELTEMMSEKRPGSTEAERQRGERKEET
ncbi:MAG: DUF72 domain-containing protein [Candidatus Omnitrophica bacterium]|nr:DUF72 domain-containing protein [Candidatus Omnitrophota bacterium]